MTERIYFDSQANEHQIERTEDWSEENESIGFMWSVVTYLVWELRG